MIIPGPARRRPVLLPGVVIAGRQLKSRLPNGAWRCAYVSAGPDAEHVVLSEARLFALAAQAVT